MRSKCGEREPHCGIVCRMGPLWVTLAAIGAATATAVLTWLLWRMNGGGRNDDGA